MILFFLIPISSGAAAPPRPGGPAAAADVRRRLRFAEAVEPAGPGADGEDAGGEGEAEVEGAEAGVSPLQMSYRLLHQQWPLEDGGFGDQVSKTPCLPLVPPYGLLKISRFVQPKRQVRKTPRRPRSWGNFSCL